MFFWFNTNKIKWNFVNKIYKAMWKTKNRFEIINKDQKIEICNIVKSIK